jgi:hypothetical protein
VVDQDDDGSDVGEVDGEEVPADFAPDPVLALEVDGLEADAVGVALGEPFAEGLDELDEPDEPDDVDDRLVGEVSDCFTCETSFLAPSSTVSPTSPARDIAKSFTVCTPSWTFGWFQTSSAALRICS